MRRRQFIAALGGSVLASLRLVRAQQADRTRRIGVLMSLTAGDPSGDGEVAAFRQGLEEFGWFEGRNINVQMRWAGGDLERIRAYANELVELRPDILVARSTPTALALKREADTIPIVFVNVSEPVGSGLAQTLARPGGNLTGFTNFEGSIGGKWLQLLKQVDPRVTRAGIIYNPQTAPFAKLFVSSVQAAAPTLSVLTVDLPVQNPSEIETTLGTFAAEQGGCLVSIPDSFSTEHRSLMIPLAARYRLPAVYSYPSATRSGGLMSYSVDTHDSMKRAAGYVDRILRGTKPAELPIQQPAQFSFSINLQTAKTLGIEFPATLIATADEVIE
jgi:putative tryptophan/tyrosine transport system substrate-binding protein